MQFKNLFIMREKIHRPMAEKLANGFLEGVIHRHVVCGMPDILWPFVEANRELQKKVMDASAKTIQAVFSDRARENIDVGIVNVLHPFGRDLIFKPHVHNVVTEGGFTKDGRFVSIGRFISYDEMHKEWQKQLLKALRGFVPDEIIDICFSKYPNGFAAYVKPERITSRKKMLEYIARYVRHPAIADSRIEAYNGEAVRFFIWIARQKRLLGKSCLCMTSSLQLLDISRISTRN